MTKRAAEPEAGGGMAERQWPFELQLAGQTLLCEESLRELPGRRLVCRGRWNQQAVVVKLYTDPGRGKRHWRRERSGLQALWDQGVATVPILLAGRCARGWALVLPELPDAMPLDRQWARGGERHRRELLERLVEILAGHHRAGLLQTDLHLANFVESEHRIYTLDGAGIARQRGRVDLRRSLQNLALLLAQLPPRHDAWAAELLDLYLHVSGYGLYPEARFRAMVTAARERRLAEFRSKLFRSCSAVRREDGKDRLLLVDRSRDSDALRGLLADPDAGFDRTRLLKDGNSATVWHVEVEGRPLVVKRYNTKNPWHGLRLRLRRSRALRSWENAQLLGFYDIATARPIAALVIRESWLRTRAYFLCELVDGPDAAHWFADPLIPGHEKAVVAQRIQRMLAELHGQRFSHGDLKASNILLPDLQPVLLDLDSMRRHRFGWAAVRAARADLRRWAHNWDALPEVASLFRQGSAGS